MKVIQKAQLTSFGGINFVFDQLLKLKIDKILEDQLPAIPNQSKYSWKDIFFSYWSVFLSGGDCAEDISKNLKSAFHNNPLVQAPSPDRLLDRLKDLAEPKLLIKKNRANTINEFSLNNTLSDLNMAILKRLGLSNQKEMVLDYDNTVIFTEKSDSRKTYKFEDGYVPGVGIVGNNIVFVENRNGNSAPHSFQEDTMERMFDRLESSNIKIDTFRADSASYQFLTIAAVAKHTKKFFIRARMSSTLADAIMDIKDWKKIEAGNKMFYRGSTTFVPFKRAAKDLKREDLLQEYRIVVTKEARKDGQLNLFTNEACVYSAIITNDFDKTDDEVVIFYNQRGKQEREFDSLKNDFAWKKLPFSKLEQNTVFLYLTAICKNIYNYLINYFSKITDGLKPHFRLKKFIFRFICIPGKWVKSGRQYKLRLFGFG
jgi:hypothetical protein